MFIYQIPSSNRGIISTPEGCDPFTFCISHFPHWLDAWGKAGIFFPSLARHHVWCFSKYSNKENLAGHALSTVVILNNSEPCWACSGKWVYGGNSVCFFVFFPALLGTLKFPCQLLLVRSVIAGLFVPFVSHLAHVRCAKGISFSQPVVRLIVFSCSTSAASKCQFEMLHKWLHYPEIFVFLPLSSCTDKNAHVKYLGSGFIHCWWIQIPFIAVRRMFFNPLQVLIHHIPFNILV